MDRLFHLASSSLYPEDRDEASACLFCAGVVWRLSLLGSSRFSLVRHLLTFSRGAGQSITCPLLVKTHEMPLGNRDRAIYVIRDGRDTLVSYAHFVLETEYGIPVGSNREAFLSMLRRLIVGQDRFGGWSANALAWKHRDPPPVLLHFEDLIADPVRALVPVLSTLGLTVKPEGDVPGFENLRRASPTLFRRGKIGSWQDEMPTKLHDLFWEHHSEAMAAFHYTREPADTGVRCR